MKSTIKNHFEKTDPILFEYSDKVTISEVSRKDVNLFFVSLTGHIIGQQLSGKVADVIEGRFFDLFPGKKVTPKAVSSLTHEQLRATGMSNAKAKFIKDLAEKVVKKELLLEKLPDLSNEDVIKELTQVKGIGPWTSEMFLMFTLGREDVFSHGDLGLKNAIKKLYKLENPTREDIEKIVNKWSPYKTYASMILWKSLELKETS